MDELRGEQVVLVPVTAADAEPLRAIHAAPEVAAWWGQPPDGFPLTDEPETTRFAIRCDGETIGMVQFGEEPDPDHRHAWIDIFVDPAWAGRGLGTDAVRALLRHLRAARGHHRVTIDPAADNAAAIRCYEKAGFRRVGTMRRAWRDPDGVWRDTLLLEMVADPLKPAAPFADAPEVGRMS